jgi:hypothetical protein
VLRAEALVNQNPGTLMAVSSGSTTLKRIKSLHVLQHKHRRAACVGEQLTLDRTDGTYELARDCAGGVVKALFWEGRPGFQRPACSFRFRAGRNRAGCRRHHGNYSVDGLLRWHTEIHHKYTVAPGG